MLIWRMSVPFVHNDFFLPALSKYSGEDISCTEHINLFSLWLCYVDRQTCRCVLWWVKGLAPFWWCHDKFCELSSSTLCSILPIQYIKLLFPCLLESTAEVLCHRMSTGCRNHGGSLSASCLAMELSRVMPSGQTQLHPKWWACRESQVAPSDMGHSCICVKACWQSLLCSKAE